MDRKLRDAVRQRARRRCEYCQLPETATELPFHVDHVIAEKHGGFTRLDNLAFACYCNRFKGTNLSGIDPETGEITRLYHPRTDLWNEHFPWAGAELIGLTRVGRATAAVLRINQFEAVESRWTLMRLGEFPP